MYERLRVYVKVESNLAQLLAKLNTCYLASIFQLREKNLRARTRT